MGFNPSTGYLIVRERPGGKEHREKWVLHVSEGEKFLRRKKATKRTNYGLDYSSVVEHLSNTIFCSQQ